MNRYYEDYGTIYSNHQKYSQQLTRVAEQRQEIMTMLHNEAREILVRGYEATHDAKAYSVSKWTVYCLVGQKRKTGSVALRTSQRGRKPQLTEKDRDRIRVNTEERPDITIEELREKLELKPAIDRCL